MGVEWDKIGQNNSHALRNLGSFPQTLSAVLGYTALGSEPAETSVHLHVDIIYMGSAHAKGSTRWYYLHIDIIYMLMRLLRTNNVDTSHRLLVQTSLTRLVNTNGVHTH